MSALLSNLRGSIPSVGSLPDVLLLLVGGLAGWLMHPLIWIAFGPFRWMAALMGIAAQESGFNASAYNDEDGHPNGGSQGLMQFQDATWTALTGRALDDRKSALLSGFYAARYVHHGMLADWRWWLIALPVVGFPILRVMWWRGNSSSAADGISAYWLERLSVENRSFVAFTFWRLVSLVPASAAALAVARVRKGRR